MIWPGWWQRYRVWRRRNICHLVLGDNGFTLVAFRREQSVRWDAIRQVTGFKRDLITVDLICLAVTTVETILEIHEDMPGYAEFEAEMCARLGIDRAWQAAVMFPPFATNPTALFRAR